METPLNMGPQHPSMHGVLHLRTIIDGEIVKSVDPDVGLIHRGLEKIAENRMYFKFTPVANKIDYVAAAAWEHCYISAVEKLIGMQIPERVKYARTIILEVQRIISHLFWIGTLSMDLGQPTVFVWALRERERLLDIFEDIMGGRMTFGWMIIGGLRDDITARQLKMIQDAVLSLERILPDYYRMTEQNEIFRQRTVGIGVITRQDAVDYGLTGPIARASGVLYDVRKDDPYLIYDKLDFNVITRAAGDCYARYEVRRDEILESIKIIRQAIKAIPDGPFRAPNAMTLRPPIALSMKTPVNGEVFVRNECPRGEGAIFIISDGSNFPYRLKIRGPSFNNMSIVSKICANQTIADVVAIIATIDPVFGECDR
jgi:NADH:ubiquinone oxidoreductase subunit D